jgi:hypothetical protein
MLVAFNILLGFFLFQVANAQLKSAKRREATFPYNKHNMLRYFWRTEVELASGTISQRWCPHHLWTLLPPAKAQGCQEL